MSTNVEKHTWAKEVVSLVRWLQGQGFADALEFVESFPSITTVSRNDFLRIIAFFREEKSKDPIRIIRFAPGILNLTDKLLAEKMVLFRDMGFVNPMSMIDREPSFATYAVARIWDRLSELSARGFKDPWTLIEANPCIPGSSMDTVDTLMKDMTSRGFGAVSILTRVPSLFGSPISLIDKKLAALQDAGVIDPVALCISHPLTLQCSVKKIASQVSVAQRITPRYGEVLSGVPIALRYSQNTLEVILTVAFAYVQEGDLPEFSLLSTLFFIGPKRLVYTHCCMAEAPESLADLRRRALRVDVSDEVVAEALSRSSLPVARLAMKK